MHPSLPRLCIEPHTSLLPVAKVQLFQAYHLFMHCTSLSIALTQVGGISIFKDVNILASHLHGFYGNPGTDNVACDPMPTDGFPCYRGDNIFADMAPGQCTWYQYDFSSVGSPGVMW